MCWEVQAKQDSHGNEHEEGAQGNAVHRGQFNRLAHAKCGVAGEVTDDRWKNGVGRKHKPSQKGGQHGVDDQRTMVFRNDLLWIHDVNFVGPNAGVEHGVADDTVAEFKVHDEQHSVDNHQNRKHGWVALQIKQVVGK